MPAPPLANTLEGGSDTTTLTSGNSGGASGDAFQTIEGTPTFSNLQAAHGTLSMRANQGVTPALRRVTWTGLGSITAAVFTRFYLRVTSVGVAQVQIHRGLTNAAAQSWSLYITSTGKLQGRNAANATLTAGTTTVPADTWMRVETRTVSGVGTGELAWRLYTDADSATITDSVTQTGLTLGANMDQTQLSTADTGPANCDTWFDDIAVSTVDWLGPSVTPTVPSLFVVSAPRSVS